MGGGNVRRAARIDSNQTEIIERLRAIGCSVLPLHVIGKGCPDLLVGFGGTNILIEVKSQRGKLTPDQVDFHSRWRGAIAIARSVDEAMAIVSTCTSSVL